MSDAAPSSQELEELARRLAARCGRGADRTLRVATAESCTGGLVGHLLTSIPGSSAWYPGGVVAYEDGVKSGVLGVPPQVLAAHGAVSAQTAVAMAEGARRLLSADIAVAVTGIAGPSGGTPAKPVGLTYVAVSDASGHDVRRFAWHHDRTGNKEASAAAAIELLLDRLGVP